MYLIVGLGNPEDKYLKTRHNAGFMVVDKFIETNNLKLDKRKFNGLYTKVDYNNKKVYIAKPETYMNNSGSFVFQFAMYFKIPIYNILIIYDEKDLDVGVIKLKNSSSSNSHNGLRSIFQQFGTSKMSRMRIGISKPARGKILSNYVLSDFSKDQKLTFDKTIEKTPEIINDFIDNGIDYVMNKYN